MSVIEIESLRKEYSTPAGTEVAVDGIDLNIEEGEFVTLVGPSGCGKTTTLRCIAGLEKPTSGTIRFEGRDVTNVPANKRKLAMMFQNIALYPHMTIRDNIVYPLKVDRVSKEERDSEAERVADVMQISELLDKHPGELSGGQRQRAALARTIVQDPMAFLMDEPLSDLDAKLKVEIRKEIQRVHKRINKPTIYVTHDQEEAMTMSDKILVLNDGKIEQLGTPDELYTYPQNIFVARFIGNPSMNFMEGTLDELDTDRATVSIEGRSFEFGLDQVQTNPSDSEITVGFRPESVSIGSYAEESDFEMQISLLERIGERVLATLDGPQGEVQATVSDDHSLREDEVVPVAIDRGGLYLFASTTGDLVAKAKKPGKVYSS